MKKLKKPAAAANLLIILLEIIGTAISFSNGGISVLKWYTVLSNITAFIASVCWLSACLRGNGDIPKWIKLLRYCAAVCLSVTFLIVVFVLVPMAIPYGTAASVLYQGPQIYHHILCPIISFISFAFLEDNTGITRSHAFIAAVPTLIYGIVAMLLNILRVIEGPYPFLLVYQQPWYMSVMWFVLIIGLAFVLARMIAGLACRKKNT